MPQEIEGDDLVMEVVTVAKGAEDPTARKDDEVARRLRSFDLRPMRSRRLDKSSQIMLAGGIVFALFVLAVILHSFTVSITPLTPSEQLIQAEWEAVEAFREADVDRDGALETDEVVAHFKDEQAEYRAEGLEVIPDPEVLPQAANRTIHADHRGHVSMGMKAAAADIIPGE